MSLCWQNLDPLEDSCTTDNSVANANPSNASKLVEAGGALARLLVWCRSVVPDLSAPTPGATSLERIGTATK
jgi:hypothetical protein